MHRQRLFLLAMVVLVLLVGAAGIIVSTSPGSSSNNRVNSVADAAPPESTSSTSSTIPAQQVLDYYTALEWQAAKASFDAAAPPPTTAPKPKPAPVRPKAAPAPTAPSSGSSRWDQLAQCETGGNWAHPPVGSYGYSGGTMTLPSTWRAYGGLQFAPAAYLATKAEQITVNERILADVGWVAWPGCSRKFGWR